MSNVKSQAVMLATGLGLLLAATVALAQNTAQKEQGKKEKKPQSIRVTGTAVDAKTGRAISGVLIQAGHVGKDGKITWGYSLRRTGKARRFSATIRWDEGWRARVIAPGYKAKPILSKRPDSNVVKDLVLKLEKGDTIKGRIVDADGAPVASAGVFVLGGRTINIYDGKAWTDYGTPKEDKTATRSQTDADGRFQLEGFDDEFHRIAISGKVINLWVVDAASREKGKEWIIKLPKTGSLEINYDIGGGPEPGVFYLQMATYERQGWKYVGSSRKLNVKNGGKLSLDGLAEGKYVLSRYKSIHLDSRGEGVFCEQQQVLVEGKTPVDFVRTKGTSVTGRVVGFPDPAKDKLPVKGAFVYVRPAKATGDPVKREYKLPTFDAFTCDARGGFTSEQLAPGSYKLIAWAYRPMDPKNGFVSGIQLPSFVGVREFTIKGSKPLKPIEIELKPYKP